MKAKRILFGIGCLDIGGAERQALHLMKYVKGQGYDVNLVATSENPGIVADECERLNIPYSTSRFRWPCRKSSLFRNTLRLRRIIQRCNPDVIYSYTTNPNIGFGLATQFDRPRIRIWGQRNTNDLRGDLVEHVACRQSSLAICNAKHEVPYLRDKVRAPKIPIEVIYNGIEMPQATRSAAAWRTRLGIPFNATVVTMLANFRQQKDHISLISAWRLVLSRMRAVESLPYLVLAGSPAQTLDDVLLHIENLELKHSVKTIGQISDVAGLLTASDIGVLISHYEGLSNSVIEYMALGLPVVATNLLGNVEALGQDSSNELCKPGDVHDIANKLCRMIYDKESRSNVGNQNKARAVKHFSVDAMCTRTHSLIESFF